MEALVLAAAIVLSLVRIYELVLDWRHRQHLLTRGAIRHGRDGLVILIASQIALLGGMLLEGVLLQRAQTLGPATWILLGVALLALALRHWCIQTLGDHWTVSVYTVPGAPLVVRGPYRFLRHPNYLAVAIEFTALPLAFGLWWTFAAAALLGVPGLLYRVRREESILAPLRVTQTGPR